MAAFDTGTVVVRSARRGTIEVGVVGAERPPAGVSTDDAGALRLVECLTAHGGDLYVDVLTLQDSGLGDVPFGVVHDPDLALWWLDFFYGEAIGDAIRRVAYDDGINEVTVPADEIEPGYLAAPMCRFVVGVWLLRWWPSRDGWANDDGLTLTEEGEQWLRLELGTLAWFLEHVFGGKDVARVLLEGQRDGVLRLTAAAQTPHDLALVRAFIESVYVDDNDLFASLAARERDTSAALRQEDALLATSALTIAAGRSLAALRERTSASASSAVEVAPVETADSTRASSRRDFGRLRFLAGGEQRVASTLAWGTVRARALSAADDNVRVTVVPSRLGSAEVRVVVDTGDRPETATSVRAAVYLDGELAEIGLLAAVPGRPVLRVAMTVEDYPEGAVVDVAIYDDSDVSPRRPEPAGTAESRNAIAAAVRRLVGVLPAGLDAVAPYDLGPSLPWPVLGVAHDE